MGVWKVSSKGLVDLQEILVHFRFYLGQLIFDLNNLATVLNRLKLQFIVKCFVDFPNSAGNGFVFNFGYLLIDGLEPMLDLQRILNSSLHCKCGFWRLVIVIGLN